MQSPHIVLCSAQFHPLFQHVLNPKEIVPRVKIKLRPFYLLSQHREMVAVWKSLVVTQVSTACPQLSLNLLSHQLPTFLLMELV